MFSIIINTMFKSALKLYLLMLFTFYKTCRIQEHFYLVFYIPHDITLLGGGLTSFCSRILPRFSFENLNFDLSSFLLASLSTDSRSFLESLESDAPRSDVAESFPDRVLLSVRVSERLSLPASLSVFFKSLKKHETVKHM